MFTGITSQNYIVKYRIIKVKCIFTFSYQSFYVFPVLKALLSMYINDIKMCVNFLTCIIFTMLAYCSLSCHQKVNNFYHIPNCYKVIQNSACVQLCLASPNILYIFFSELFSCKFKSI